MDYKVTGLSAEPFRNLYGKTEAELAQFGVIRLTVDQDPGFPDRIEMRDARLGESVLLLNHVCQPASSPFRASHAIYVREGAEETYASVNQIPPVMLYRLLSLRAYDDAGMMLDADVVDGRYAAGLVEKLFADPQVSYIHAHNAKRGCYSGRIERA
jgi:hypothetical protein